VISGILSAQVLSVVAKVMPVDSGWNSVAPVGPLPFSRS
jgi:hypothetical protein